MTIIINLEAGPKARQTQYLVNSCHKITFFKLNCFLATNLCLEILHGLTLKNKIELISVYLLLITQKVLFFC